MMPNVSKITDEQLIDIRAQVEQGGKAARAWQIAELVKKNHNVDLDESTIRGRFIVMGKPLSGAGAPPPKEQPKVEQSATAKKKIEVKPYEVAEELKKFIPKADDFSNYIERPVDTRLAMHYDLGKYPLCQGKQGTGKTTSNPYYAMKRGLPYFEFCCHPDFKLHKLFGDKTIINGNVLFVESILVRAIQGPSVILFDEINRLDETETAAFHGLLASRKLFVKDADNGLGKWYQLHPDCKIGFAMNPKSAKYVGTQIKNSAFIGRCTFITYPDFTKKEISDAIMKRFPAIHKDDREKFVTFYFSAAQVIERSQLPLDISIRQLNNVVELWLHGMPLKDAIEDGMTSITEAASQPKAKESFYRVAQAIWKELMAESKDEKLGCFLLRIGGLL